MATTDNIGTWVKGDQGMEWQAPNPGQPGYNAGQNWINPGQYWWNAPGGQEYLTTVGQDPSQQAPYGGKYGTATTAQDPWGGVGQLSSQANQWGVQNNPGDFLSRMGPGILGLPLGIAAAGNFAFGGGLDSLLGGGVPGVDPVTGAGGFGEGAPGVMTPADTAGATSFGMDQVPIPTGNIPGVSGTSGGVGTSFDTANLEGGTDLSGAGTTTFGGVPGTGMSQAPWSKPFSPTDFTGAVSSAAGGGGGGVGGITGSDIWNFMKDNKNLLLPGAAMAASLFKKPDLSTGGLESVAGDIKGYMNMLTGGQLPPGAEASVSNALNAAKQSIRSKYAQMGMAGSTMESQELSQAENNAVAMRFSIAQQIANTGLQAAGLDTNIYNAIMNATLQQDERLQNALANFAMAAAMGSAR